jgi:hypothetical protein
VLLRRHGGEIDPTIGVVRVDRGPLAQIVRREEPAHGTHGANERVGSRIGVGGGQPKSCGRGNPAPVAGDREGLSADGADPADRVAVGRKGSNRPARHAVLESQANTVIVQVASDDEESAGDGPDVGGDGKRAGR